MWEYEEQLRQEKMKVERAAWKEQQRSTIETKEREIEIEKRARETAVNLPKLSIAPFKSTPKDWIRFSRHRGTFTTTEKRGPRCFYCPKKHWPDQCDTVINKKERREILKRNGACFKCRENHLMKSCTRRGCFICQGNHHSSLYEERDQKPEESLISYNPSSDCIMPLIPAEVKGQQIWGILDTGATKNYISRKAVGLLKLKPLRWETNSLRTAAGQTTAKRGQFMK